MLENGSSSWNIRFGRKKARNYFLLASILSLGYAWFVSSLPIDAFLDRQNYFNYIDNSYGLLRFQLNNGFLAFFSNEPLWLFINSVLNDGFSNPENAIRLYIFLSAGVFSFFLLRSGPKYFFLLVLFLFFPQIIKNYIVHLRQGVAIAVFFVGWNLQSRRIGWFLMAITPFIHASFFFIMALIVVRSIISKIKISSDAQISIFFIFSLALSVSVGFLAAELGARQAEYYTDSISNFSGLGFVFWLGICILFLFQGREYFRKFSLEILILIFYLTSYFFTAISARIFESALILILLAGLRLDGFRFRIFIFSILFYVSYSYIIRWNEPWLGFGV